MSDKIGLESKEGKGYLGSSQPGLDRQMMGLPKLMTREI
jgi:hypothetical protein